MLVYFLFLTVALILIYPNTFRYVFALLVFVLFSLFYLTSISYLSTILFLIVLAVYLGAMIIFIGYICAISPNVLLSSSFYTQSYSLIFLTFLSFFFLFIYVPKLDLLTSLPLANSFYSPFGFFIFFLLLFFLFISLLIVTSYYLSSKGPFRSTSA